MYFVYYTIQIYILCSGSEDTTVSCQYLAEFQTSVKQCPERNQGMSRRSSPHPNKINNKNKHYLLTVKMPIAFVLLTWRSTYSFKIFPHCNKIQVRKYWILCLLINFPKLVKILYIESNTYTRISLYVSLVYTLFPHISLQDCNKSDTFVCVLIMRRQG